MDIRFTIDDENGWGIWGRSATGNFDAWIAAGIDPIIGIQTAAMLPETGVEWPDGMSAPVESVYVDDRRRPHWTIDPDGSFNYIHPCPDWFISLNHQAPDPQANLHKEGPLHEQGIPTSNIPPVPPPIN